MRWRSDWTPTSRSRLGLADRGPPEGERGAGRPRQRPSALGQSIRAPVGLGERRVRCGGRDRASRRRRATTVARRRAPPLRHRSRDLREVPASSRSGRPARLGRPAASAPAARGSRHRGSDLRARARRSFRCVWFSLVVAISVRYLVGGWARAHAAGCDPSRRTRPHAGGSTRGDGGGAGDARWSSAGSRSSARSLSFERRARSTRATPCGCCARFAASNRRNGYSTALANDPLSLDLEREIAALAFTAGRHGEAIERLERLRSIDPDFPFVVVSGPGCCSPDERRGVVLLGREAPAFRRYSQPGSSLFNPEFRCHALMRLGRRAEAERAAVEARGFPSVRRSRVPVSSISTERSPPSSG